MNVVELFIYLLQILPGTNDLSSVSSEDGYVSHYYKSTPDSVRSEESCKSNKELPTRSGDYLLNNLPPRPKPPSRRPSAKNRYRLDNFIIYVYLDTASLVL